MTTEDHSDRARQSFFRYFLSFLRQRAVIKLFFIYTFFIVLILALFKLYAELTIGGYWKTEQPITYRQVKASYLLPADFPAHWFKKPPVHAGIDREAKAINDLFVETAGEELDSFFLQCREIRDMAASGKSLSDEAWLTIADEMQRLDSVFLKILELHKKIESLLPSDPTSFPVFQEYEWGGFNAINLLFVKSKAHEKAGELGSAVEFKKGELFHTVVQPWKNQGAYLYGLNQSFRVLNELRSLLEPVDDAKTLQAVLQPLVALEPHLVYHVRNHVYLLGIFSAAQAMRIADELQVNRKNKRVVDWLREIAESEYPVPDFMSSLETYFISLVTGDYQRTRQFHWDNLLCSICSKGSVEEFQFSKIYNYPNYDRLIEQEIRVTLLLHKLQIELAARLYTLEQGKPPKRAEVLVPKWLKKAPINPISGRPYDLDQVLTRSEEAKPAG